MKTITISIKHCVNVYVQITTRDANVDNLMAIFHVTLL